MANIVINSVALSVHIPSKFPTAILIFIDESLPYTPPPDLPLGVNLGPHEFPIFLCTGSIQLSDIPRLPPSFHQGISIQQFPIITHFALTCYKVQGKTLCDGAIIAYWKSPVRNVLTGRKRRNVGVKPQYAYVVCSHVQSIDKLFVVRDLDATLARQFKHVKAARDEDLRLMKIHDYTIREIYNE